jgi:hypothetical protein
MSWLRGAAKRNKPFYYTHINWIIDWDQGPNEVNRHSIYSCQNPAWIKGTFFRWEPMKVQRKKRDATLRLDDGETASGKRI